MSNYILTVTSYLDRALDCGDGTSVQRWRIDGGNPHCGAAQRRAWGRGVARVSVGWTGSSWGGTGWHPESRVAVWRRSTPARFVGCLILSFRFCGYLATIFMPVILGVMSHLRKRGAIWQDQLRSLYILLAIRPWFSKQTYRHGGCRDNNSSAPAFAKPNCTLCFFFLFQGLCDFGGFQKCF